MSKKTKTEHSGAKNGGGFWGTREEAKELSNQKRRAEDHKYKAFRPNTTLGTCKYCHKEDRQVCEHDFCGVCQCPKYCWVD